MSQREQLDSYLKQAEKRLRLDIALRGAAILTSAALGTTVILVLVTNALAFSEGSIAGARLVLLFAVVAALGLGSALPLYALNRRRAAAKVEAAFPFFQQRLLTFVDRGAGRHEPFMELLAADSMELAPKAEPAGLAPDRRLLISITAAVACLGILIWMVIAGPGFWGYGAARLWTVSSLSPAAFYDIRITPGNAVIRRNAAQTITAQLVGFQSPQARFYARSQSASKWEEAPMQPQADGPGFKFVFAGVPEDLEYYVGAGLVRSRRFKIRVTDLPSVKEIRVTYHYPAWTGMHDAVEEHGGDLRAVEGTEAELSISTDRPLQSGVLVLNSQQQIPLSGREGDVYQSAIRIEKDGQYYIAALDQGQLVRLSDDFFIEATKVNPPEVSITRPGGDCRASPIEEVSLSVKAHDDYGLNEVSLHYSVNGSPQHTVDLLKHKEVKAVEGSTTLYLEDFKLVPGDVVSIYAKAKNSNSESRSGMIFIQAEPFEREYSQSQSAGGGGGGQEFEIAQREKEIIGATWQQQGDKTRTRQQSAETARFLSGVQTKLRAQASALGGRIESRELSNENDAFRAFQQDMNVAADAMGPASEKLKQQQWNAAIPKEEKALQHLLRAEATFRQIQVAFGNSGGGGGAGAGAGGELASLLNLELDTEKNQYEAGQTAASASQRAEQLDKALQKLDELARRQQELADQQRAASNQNSQQRWQQEMLRRQAEQLQRQMEQLAQGRGQSPGGSQASSQAGSSSAGNPESGVRSQSTADQRIQRALNQLRQANQDMRRAASPGQTAADARRAADRLQRAARLLDGVKQQQGAGQLGPLVREADRLAGQEHEESARIRKAFGQKNPSSSHPGSDEADGEGDEGAKLADDRQLMAADLSRLEKAAQDAARQLASGDRETSSKLDQALGEMDGSNLQSRLQHSAESMRLGLPPDDSLESSISADIDRFDQRMHEAQQALKEQQQSPNDALKRLERLRRQIDALTRSLGDRTSGIGPSSEQSQAGRQSQTAQPSQAGGQGQGGQTQVAQGQAGQQAQGGQGTQGGTANGFQPGGPGGPRLWRGGLQGAGNENEVGQPGIDASGSSASAELSRERALRELDGLRREIRSEPGTQAAVQDLMRDLQRLGPGIYGNPALTDQLRARVLAAMDNLELRLRRDLDQQESGEVRDGDSLRVPPGYQESVAEYFRRLSKTH